MTAGETSPRSAFAQGGRLYLIWEQAAFLTRHFANETPGMQELLAYLLLKNNEGHLRIALPPLIAQGTLARDIKAAMGQFRDSVLPPQYCGSAPELDPALLTRTLTQATRLAGIPEDRRPLVLWQGHLYTRRAYSMEKNLLERLETRLKMPLPAWPEAACAQGLQDTLLDLSRQGMTLSPEQQTAVKAALCLPFLLVDGGPGTGKTFTAEAMLRACLHTALRAVPASFPLKIFLAAPTAVAAKRLEARFHRTVLENNALPDESAAKVEAAMPRAAMTVHRLLSELRQRYGLPPSEVPDIVLIDEGSMIDVDLMLRLLETVPLDTRMIILGDRNQLPSVDQGAVFRDLVPQSADATHRLKHHGVYLETCHRSVTGIKEWASWVNHQDEDRMTAWIEKMRFESWDDLVQTLEKGGGPTAGQAVLWIDPLWFKSPPGRQKAWYRKCLENLAFGKIPAELRDGARYCLPGGDGGEALARVRDLLEGHRRLRILTLTHEGVAGSRPLNENLMESIHGSRDAYYPGLPVMLLKNDHRNHLYNGDQGLVVQREDGSYRVAFVGDGELRLVHPASLQPHVPAYAVTVHKSQGMEWDSVLLALPPEPSALCTKEILYTAVTRARNQVLIVGSEASLRHCIRNQGERCSGIRDYLLAPPAL